jgi:uncharacterized membrane protein YbhN (UPF0104 family)
VIDEPPSQRSRSLWLLIRYVIGLTIGVVILVVLLGRRGQLVSAWHQLGNLNVAWEMGAILAEVLSIVGLAHLQRWVLRCGGSSLAFGPLTMVSLANIAIANTIPGEPAVSCALSARLGYEGGR